MAVPVNKDELIQAIMTQYSKLQKDLYAIPKQLSSTIGIDGHVKNTLITPHNLVSYLVGWGELVIKWYTKKHHNEIVDFPETGYKWNALGPLAQKFYADYQDIPFNDLLTKLDQTVDTILEIVRNNTNHQLYEVAWYDKWTLGRMIQFNTSSPYTNARGRIRQWKKENPSLFQ